MIRVIVTGMALCLPVVAVAQDDSLVDRLRSVASPAWVTSSGELAGPGGELLQTGVRESRFTLLGEEHGVAQVPQLAELLWRTAVANGYSHFAIEVGEQLAGGMERALRSKADGSGYLQFLKDHWPGAPFYFWKEDAALLQSVIASMPGKRGVLWGCDYDIFADRHAFERLRALAPTPAVRRVVDSARAIGDSALDRALAQQNPGLVLMFGGSPELLARVRAAFHPAAGSEADRILSLMEETLTINRLFMTGQGYQSNQRRSALLKHQFWRLYDSTRKAERSAPKVFLKFGASHVVRGRNFSNAYDLGTLVPELAEQEGGRAFSLYVVGGPGTSQAQIDPRRMRSMESPVSSLTDGWAAPFVAATDSTRWTVFDLRQLRVKPGNLTQLGPVFLQVLYGYDALVVLTGSGPQHDLIDARP